MDVTLKALGRGQFIHSVIGGFACLYMFKKSNVCVSLHGPGVLPAALMVRSISMKCAAGVRILS